MRSEWKFHFHISFTRKYGVLKIDACPSRKPQRLPKSSTLRWPHVWPSNSCYSRTLSLSNWAKSIKAMELAARVHKYRGGKEACESCERKRKRSVCGRAQSGLLPEVSRSACEQLVWNSRSSQLWRHEPRAANNRAEFIVPYASERIVLPELSETIYKMRVTRLR